MATWRVKPPCLLVELRCSWMCASRSQLSGTLRSERGREGGSSKRGKLGKRGLKKILLGVFSLPVGCLSFFSLHRIFPYLLPLIFRLAPSLPPRAPHPARAFKQASAHPAAISQDSPSASISRLVSIWHRASRPVRHSPVPPHSALLVTPDNWRRNPKFRRGRAGGTDLGSCSEPHGDIKGCF